MAAPTPRLESWIYAGLPGLRTIQVSDSGGAWHEVTLTTSATISDALAEWATLAGAATGTAETYTFEVTAAGLVRFDSSGDIDIRLYGSTGPTTSLASLLGFSSGDLSGTNEYFSDQALAGIIFAPLDYTAPMPRDMTVARTYRHRRAEVLHHHLAHETRISALVTQAQKALIETGPILSGRVRVYPTGYTSGAYAAANLRGYLDVWPHTIAPPEVLGEESEYVLTVTGGL